ncbi:hypothetical protein [Streptomyces sp. cf386]|uniref:hypothetical protein n=1 Tax=Streptomyces sp. cf386 TaxID=1761904 RepID=UPI0015A356D9
MRDRLGVAHPDLVRRGPRLLDVLGRGPGDPHLAGDAGQPWSVEGASTFVLTCATAVR